MNLKIQFSKILAILVIIGLSITSCKEKDSLGSTDDFGFRNYVYAYTSGVISRAAPIRIRFTESLADATEIGEPIQNGILSFSPNISGNATWEDDKTILFEPSENLKTNTKYSGKVNLSQVFQGVPKDLQTFAFDFRTKEQFMNVSVEGLRAMDIGDLTEQELVGTIYTTDVAKAENVEKLLTANQSGNNNIKVTWDHDADQMHHHFIIQNVKRGKKASAVNLEWNGKALGLKAKGDKEVEVPALGDFKVTNAKIQQDGDQSILLVFSDPLLQSQDLAGLVSIRNSNVNLRYVIDGNQLRVYPAARLAGERTVVVSKGLKNINNFSMASPSEWTIQFAEVKPQVKIVGEGVIMPNSKGLILPFEAVSLHSVWVEVFKIYENNVLQFLQTNELDGTYELARVGRVELQKEIALRSINPTADYSQWNRYALDLSDFLQREPNAIYQVRIGFKQNHSTYFCGSANSDDENNESESNLTRLESDVDENGDIISFWDASYGYYRYSDRDDPCKEAYYKSYYRHDHWANTNIIASDLGMIAKKGTDGTYFVAVSNLVTTEPQSGTRIEFFDYQQQLIGAVTTDGDGIAEIKLDRNPFVVVASKGDQKGYLKVKDGYSLSLSRFDVAGAKPQKGLKGYLYGERGVWRPGDSLFLNFVLEDKKNALPSNHPVTFEFYDPRGQLVQKTTKSENVNHIYNFNTVTDVEAPTGNWLARVKVGGATFEKSIKIETVKPNRLKIALDFGKEELASTDKNLEGDLQVNWLHGAPAKNFRAEVKVQFKSTPTKFDQFGDFVFDDPARSFSTEPQVVFDKNVDEEGKATINIPVSSTGVVAPGKLTASFTTRAFENSGEFSTDNFTIPYHPYSGYVGVHIPKKRSGEKRLDMDKDSQIEFLAVNTEGKVQSNKQLEVGLYRINWRWWWDRSGDNVTSYNSSNHYNAVKKETLRTNDKGEAAWTLNMDNWGRYLVRVCDPETGHCSGDIFYSGYPWYDDESVSRDAAAMLSFSSDKQSYKVGETVELNIPMGQEGRALVTLENGSGVVETYWMKAKKGENKFRFTANEKMTPTVYAHVSLIQPHAQVQNDLPIRLYGVIPVTVEDPKTKLEPIVDMPDVLRPEQTIKVKVREKNKQAMAYTLAIVDDGLLDLTRFKTPNPWDHFYAREALGVQTWDVYDKVMGAYGGELERILSIGGGDGLGPVGGQKANRFKPVVMHLGPFYLKKGRTATHEIEIPNYIGSVRTMVVAANDGAYGSVEKTTPVKKPLMVLGTLPRVLGPTEKVKLPVTVFAMEKKIKNVTVTIETNDLLKINGKNSQTLKFDKIGEQEAYFDLEVAENIGIAKVKIIAKSAGEVATHEIELDVRNPNPYVVNVIEDILEAGEEWTKNFGAVGMEGTNEGILEVSNIPPINLGERLDYLIRYPHGCIEQTTSSGFPQLYVGRLLEIDKDKKSEIDNNVKATIDRLNRFQTSDGGFAYWPGDNDPSHWGSNYAGHFMLAAQELGYSVPSGMVKKWTNFQKRVARNWTDSNSEYNYYGDQADLMQAYRLYTLALADAPEWGAMNRLREKKDLSLNAKWRLAAAYAKAGKEKIAKDLTQNLATTVSDYNELGYTYGSSLRDEAMILETLTLLKDRKRAADLVKTISEDLSMDRWYSTQTVAYSLLAVGQFVGGSKVDDKFVFQYQIGGGNMVNAGSDNPVVQLDVDVDDLANKSVKVKNTGSGIIYARLILTGQPSIGDSTSSSSNLNLNIAYKTLDGQSLNPSSIEQGTDFIAEVTVAHPGDKRNYEELALTQIFPSGWEIHNARMNNVQSVNNTIEPEYQDIRDDRVYTYFDMKRGASHTYRIQLNAAYQGRYYMPTVSCEAMYDNKISARQPGGWVEVVGDVPSAN